MTGLTRAQLVANARVFALREAIVSHLAPLFADVAVQAHPGKIDIADAVAKGTFTAPCVALAATRMKPEGRLSHGDDFLVSLTAYVVADSVMVGGRLVYGDELALGICQAILVALSDDALTSWGLQDIGPAEEAEGAPLFTVKSVTQGTVYYAVSWKQTLYAVTTPLFGPRYEGEPEL